MVLTGLKRKKGVLHVGLYIYNNQGWGLGRNGDLANAQIPSTDT